MACAAMVLVVMTCLEMAFTVVAHIVMAYIAMAYILMAARRPGGLPCVLSRQCPAKIRRKPQPHCSAAPRRYIGDNYLSHA